MNVVIKNIITQNHIFILPWYMDILILIAALGIVVWIIRKKKKNKQ